MLVSHSKIDLNAMLVQQCCGQVVSPFTTEGNLQFARYKCVSLSPWKSNCCKIFLNNRYSEQLVQLQYSWYTVGTQLVHTVGTVGTVGTKIATVAKDYNSGTDQYFMSWESPPSRVFAFMRLGQLCGRSHLIISFLIFCTVWLRNIQKKIGLQKQNRSKAQIVSRLFRPKVLLS